VSKNNGKSFNDNFLMSLKALKFLQ